MKKIYAAAVLACLMAFSPAYAGPGALKAPQGLKAYGFSNGVEMVWKAYGKYGERG